MRSLVPLLLLVGAIGCDAVFGIELLPVGAAVRYAAVDCERCVNADCAAASKACLADRACEPLARCLALCPPDEVRCRADCEAASPLAVATPSFAALDRCVRGVCTEACTGVGGLARMFGACDCLEKACKPSMLACIRSSLTDPAAQVGECERGLACMAAGGVDPKTFVRCEGAYGAGTEVKAVKECFATTECAGCPVAGTSVFGCVGKYRWPNSSVPKAKVTFKVVRFEAAQTAIPNVKVRACGGDTCDICDTTTPLAEGRSGADGTVTLEVPTGVFGFSGCFDFSADGYTRMSLGLGRPVQRDTSTVMFLVSADSMPVLGLVAGTTLNPDRGHIVAFATDCFINFASGASFELLPTDPGIKSGYLIGNTLDLKATETGRLGAAMFLNIPPGFVTMQMRHAGRLVGSTPATVRKGVLTAVINLPKTQD